MFILLLLLLAFFSIILVSINCRKLRLIWEYPKSKLFMYVPIIGHLGLCRYSWPSMKNVMYLMNLAGTESGKMLLIAGIRCILISKAEHLDVVLNHPNAQKKPYTYDFLKAGIGDSILRIGGKRWKDQRKAMSPTMHPTTLAAYAEDMNRISNILVDKFKRNDKTFDVTPDIGKCLMDVIISTSFGVDMNLQADSDSKFIHCIESYAELMEYRLITIPLHSDLIYRFTNAHKLQKKCEEYTRTVVKKIFEEKKAIYDKELEIRKLEASIEEQAGRNRIFIDHLLDLQQNGLFTEQIVIDELYTLLAGALDTGTSAICFTLLALAVFPEMQEQVYKEIMGVIGTERLIEYNDLSKFVYLEKIIKESLRMFPPGPVILRQAKDEFTLDGHIVPKDTQLACNIMAVHRSPLYWKDPMTFDPERFSSEGIAKQVKNSYIPFSAGPRICFGTRYAWMMMKIVIAMIIRNYKIFTPYKSLEDAKLDMKIVLRAQDGFLMRLEGRNN